MFVRACWVVTSVEPVSNCVALALLILKVLQVSMLELLIVTLKIFEVSKQGGMALTYWQTSYFSMTLLVDGLKVDVPVLILRERSCFSMRMLSVDLQVVVIVSVAFALLLKVVWQVVWPVLHFLQESAVLLAALAVTIFLQVVSSGGKP